MNVPQPCGCWCWTLAQPRGWWWDRDDPTTSKPITWALVAAINRGTGLCQGNPPPASVGDHPVGAQGCSKGREQHLCCPGTPAQAQVYSGGSGEASRGFAVGCASQCACGVVVWYRGPAHQGSQGTVGECPPTRAQHGKGFWDLSDPGATMVPLAGGFLLCPPGYHAASDAQTWWRRRRLRVKGDLSALCPQLLRNV